MTSAHTEAHTFTLRSDDGVRLWIDGRLVIDAWNDHPVRDDRATVALTAGRAHAIRLEHYDNGGHAVARLSWSSPSRPTEVVPSSALRP